MSKVLINVHANGELNSPMIQLMLRAANILSLETKLLRGPYS